MAKQPPIALVLPWYGPDVVGGAETNARHLAEHLRASGVPIEVWTTCARDADADWNRNHHPPGRSTINGVPVTRFPVTPVNRDRSWPIYRRLARGGRATPEEEALIYTLSIRSRALCEHIRAHPEHVCVLTPYHLGTTYWGAYAAPGRAWLIPCLHHEEGFARLAALRHLLGAARGVLCYSHAEMRLMRRLFDVPAARLTLIGSGIATDKQGHARAFRERYGISAPFILYTGRKTAGKNALLLLTYFCRYRQRRDTDLELVLIGSGQVSIPPDCRYAVHDLGFVPEQNKHDAYAAATVFCQPSVHESFSIVLMEAWVQGAAALVSARCDVTREHCQQSQGGLYFDGYQEFEAILDLLLSDGGLRQRLGQRGRRYVEQNYTWEQIMNRFLKAVYNL
ncbi:MAG: glycosyltransferase family 4 protein [Anaerolineae bacterium]